MTPPPFLRPSYALRLCSTKRIRLVIRPLLQPPSASLAALRRSMSVHGALPVVINLRGKTAAGKVKGQLTVARNFRTQKVATATENCRHAGIPHLVNIKY
jgi:hypothetical protein